MFTEHEFEKLDQEELESETETLEALLVLLSDFKDELTDETIYFYQQYGKNGVVDYQTSRKRVSLLDRRLRIAVLYLFVDDLLQSTLQQIESQTKRYFIELIEREADFFGIKLNASDVSDILNKRWGTDNLNWEQRLWNKCDTWYDVICDDFLTDFIKRNPFSVTYKQLEKRFKSMDKWLVKWVDGEASAIRSVVRHNAFKELGYKRYRFFTQADERTCDECAPLHGLVFPMSAFKIGVTAPPIHPHCRDWIEPIV